METIVITDTNIFIDLYKLNLLDTFFRLPIEIHTTDFVIHELTSKDQKQAIPTSSGNGVGGDCFFVMGEAGLV